VWYFSRFFLVAALLLIGSPSVADSENCALRQLASLNVTMSSDGWVLIPIQVGPTKLEAVIDFGARYSILREAVAQELQLKLVTFERESRFIFGGVAKYKSRAPLKFGNMSIGDTAFAVVQKPIGNDPRVAASLGVDVLTMFDVELDLAHGKVNLFAKNHCPGKVVYWTQSSPVSSVPLNFTAWDWLQIPVQVNGRYVAAVISPISEDVYVNPHHSVQNFGVEIHAPDLPVVDLDQIPMMPLGRSTPAITLGLKTIAMGGITILNPTTHVFDCDDGAWSIERTACPDMPNIALGVSELKKIRVYLDFQDRMFYATVPDAN